MSENFRNFSSLPAEIRSMIWEYSLPEPRVYEVLDAPNAKQKTPAQDGLMFANVHPEPPPALAAVCRESRYFVLRHYKALTLGRTTKYVDLARDMLLLEPYLLVKRLHRTLHFMSQIPLVRDNINCLALGTSYGVYTGICHPVLSWKVSKNNMGKLLGALSKFARLKTLIFIVHQEFQFEFDFRYPPTYPLAAQAPLPMPGSTSTSTSHISSSLASSISSSSSSSPSSSIANSPITLPLNAPPSLLPLPLPPLPLPPQQQQQQQHLRPPPPPPPVAMHSPSPAPSLPPPALRPPHPTSSSPSPPPPPSNGAAASAAPIPIPTLMPRPQVVHQAYRFKFDIEANINYHPRRPHLNELLYYPLDMDEEKDDWDSLIAAGVGSSGGGLGGADDEENEWCDPWPTNDDWKRFKKRFQRGVLMSLEMGLAEGFTREMLPAIKGASLLWRYTRGGY